jgi:2-dehydropantoate 2-reductase
LAPLIGAGTSVVTVQNGVEAPELVAATIGAKHVLPGLARLVATPLGPGEIQHVGPPAALAFAEWDGSTSDRVRQLRETFGAAGVGAPEPADIWVELWTKFLMITPIGSLGAATGGADIGTLRSRPGTRALLLAGMREIYQTARALGVPLPEETVDRAAAVMDGQTPGATTSLQRDLLAGRPSELDAWTGAAVRLAARAGCAVPVLGTLYELLATRAAQTEAAA